MIGLDQIGARIDVLSGFGLPACALIKQCQKTGLPPFHGIAQVAEMSVAQSGLWWMTMAMLRLLL